MALREDECFLVRRFAAGGIDKNIGGSRVGGKNRFSICRVAARGSNGVYSNHRDLKIKRLHEQVQDLEVSSTWKETEPEELVRDELSVDEEHPTNGDTIYDSLPVYDEYGDEQWYSWFSGGVAVVVASEAMANVGHTVVKDDHEYLEVSTGWFVYFYKKAMVDGGATMVGCKSVAAGGDELEGGVELLLGRPTILPKVVGEVKVDSQYMRYGMHSNILIGDGDNNIEEANKADNIIKRDNIGVANTHSNPRRTLPIFLILTKVSTDKIETVKAAEDELWKMLLVCSLIQYREENTSGHHQIVDADNHVVEMTAINYVTTNGSPNGLVKKGGGFQLKHDGRQVLEEQVNNKQLNIQFDPSGTSIELGEEIRKVSLLKRVMIIIIQSRVDVPFDPGGVGLRAKLEDEFFS